jgi:hypothetical protein
MKTILLCGLLAASPAAWSHPGHGLPGWIHPHVADYVLLGLAGVYLAAWLVLRLKKAVA